MDFGFDPPCPLNKLSISQIFLNKKRRNLKKGKPIDRYSFERRNQGWGKQKNGEMGSPRITVCRARGHQKKEKINQYCGKLGWASRTIISYISANLAATSATSDLGNSPYFQPSAARMIASLGGFFARKGADVKTI